MSTVGDKNPPAGIAMLSIPFTVRQIEQALLRCLFWPCLFLMLLPVFALGQTIHNVAGDTAGTVLKNPSGLFVSPDGSAYIADTGKHRIRLVDPFGVIATIAGDSTAGYAGDGGATASAKLNSPTGVFVDKNGAIYIADRDNHRIRKVATDSTISTVAGNGTPGFFGDGGRPDMPPA